MRSGPAQGRRAWVTGVLSLALGCAGSNVSGPSAGEPGSTAQSGGSSAALLAGKIAFMSRRDGNDEIYSMNGDGSNVTRLTHNTAGDVTPAWSPDRRKIAFSRGSSFTWKLYVMNADGSGAIQRTNLVGARDDQPAWSPDGAKIAFTRHTHTFVNRQIVFHTDIYVINANGSGLTRLTTTEHASEPAWSPGSSKIAFTSLADGFDEIFVMRIDGSGVTRLTHNSVDDFDPAWSPDGTKLAFVRFPSNNCCEDIYVMSANGSAVTQLTKNLRDDVGPSWSLDGSKIAFASNASRTNVEVYVMNANGSDVTRLTNSPDFDGEPAWRP